MRLLSWRVEARVDGPTQAQVRFVLDSPADPASLIGQEVTLSATVEEGGVEETWQGTFVVRSATISGERLTEVEAHCLSPAWYALDSTHSGANAVRWPGCEWRGRRVCPTRLSAIVSELSNRSSVPITLAVEDPIVGSEVVWDGQTAAQLLSQVLDGLGMRLLEHQRADILDQGDRIAIRRRSAAPMAGAISSERIVLGRSWQADRTEAGRWGPGGPCVRGASVPTLVRREDQRRQECARETEPSDLYPEFGCSGPSTQTVYHEQDTPQAFSQSWSTRVQDLIGCRVTREQITERSFRKDTGRATTRQTVVTYSYDANGKLAQRDEQTQVQKELDSCLATWSERRLERWTYAVVEGEIVPVSQVTMEWGVDEADVSCSDPSPTAKLKRIERRDILVSGTQAVRRTHVEQYAADGNLVATTRSVDVSAGEWKSRQAVQTEIVERAKSAVFSEWPQNVGLPWLLPGMGILGIPQPTISARRLPPCEPPQASVPEGYEVQNRPVESGGCADDSVSVNVPLLADQPALEAIRSAFATMPRYEVRAQYELVPVLWLTPGVWVTLEGQQWYVEQVVLERTPDALKQSISVVRWLS